MYRGKILCEKCAKKKNKTNKFIIKALIFVSSIGLIQALLGPYQEYREGLVGLRDALDTGIMIVFSAAVMGGGSLYFLKSSYAMPRLVQKTDRGQNATPVSPK